MRKLKALKLRKGLKKKKEKRNHVLWVGKAYFSSCYFFIILFYFALQTWFLELEVMLPWHLKTLKMKRRWGRSKEVFCDKVVIGDGQSYPNAVQCIRLVLTTMNSKTHYKENQPTSLKLSIWISYKMLHKIPTSA